MTQAICFKCGNIKHGAFKSCHECHQRPRTEKDLVNSLCLTDHYFPIETLIKIGEKIKLGYEIEFEAKLVQKISIEINKLLKSPMGEMLTSQLPIKRVKKWWQFWS